MVPSRMLSRVTAGAVLALAVAVPLYAQGQSNGKGNSHKSSPPSSSPLPSPVTGPAASVPAPVAWIDDASLLAPGWMAVTVSSTRWSGTDLSEVNFPVVDTSVGLTPRLQIGASVPHIVGGADGTPVGGVGTSYITSKIAVLTGASEIKLAVSPLLQILGDAAVQSLVAGDGRVQFGLPVSVELAQGPARVFASTGFFSRGIWFAGGGVSVQATPKVGASLSFTRSWSNDSATGVSADRRELSGGASYLVKPQVAVFGALGRTIGTTDESGAGTTVSGGVSVLFNARSTK